MAPLVGPPPRSCSAHPGGVQYAMFKSKRPRLTHVGSLLSSKHPCWVRGVRVRRWVQGVRVGFKASVLGFEVSALGSRRPCWVQGIRVGFKASALGVGFEVLGWKCPCVRSIRVGFMGSTLGSRVPCWVQGVHVGFKASMLGSRYPR